MKASAPRGYVQAGGLVWTAVGLGVFVVLALIFFSWVGTQLKASLVDVLSWWRGKPAATATPLPTNAPYRP